MARKLTVIMHAIWSDGTFYVGHPAAGQAELRPARMARPQGSRGTSMSVGAVETHGVSSVMDAIVADACDAVRRS